MSAIHLEWNPVVQQLESLRALVEELRREVGELRQQVNSTRLRVAECGLIFYLPRKNPVLGSAISGRFAFPNGLEIMPLERFSKSLQS